MAARPHLPSWAQEIAEAYESGAHNQFILTGNINDSFLNEASPDAPLLDLPSYLLKHLLANFDIILIYDVGQGLRVLKGEDLFHQWPALKNGLTLSKEPRPAIEALTHCFRYHANLSALKKTPRHIACVIRDTHLVTDPKRADSNPVAFLLREWSLDPSLRAYPLATFLTCENLSDLHPLLSMNARCAKINIPVPTPSQLQSLLDLKTYQSCLAHFPKHERLAAQLQGLTLTALESILRLTVHRKSKLQTKDIVEIRKDAIESENSGLIDFIQSDLSLDHFQCPDNLRSRLKSDIALWQSSDATLIPSGYLLCGPVGTGKTFLVKCLAGEASIPVVIIKNFRDKWIGSTEANLEKIFRLLKALGRCLVFLDEADQVLGRRQSDSGDSGISGRVYAMIAEEMSCRENRGKIIWFLASSRPDLIEIDLKRPGRIDIRIPLFPATELQDRIALLSSFLEKHGISLSKKEWTSLKKRIPDLLTPSAAETLALGIARERAHGQKQKSTPLAIIQNRLQNYHPPVPHSVIQSQIQLAIAETSDHTLIPPPLLCAS